VFEAFKVGGGEGGVGKRGNRDKGEKESVKNHREFNGERERPRKKIWIKFTTNGGRNQGVRGPEPERGGKRVGWSSDPLQLGVK